MHNSYVDRGIIKWSPFDALVGFHGVLAEMKHHMHKMDKPILSDDQYQTLNQKLMLAFQLQLDIDIVYFHDGYLKTTFGHIKKLDWVNHIIVFTHMEKISAFDVIDIVVQEDSSLHDK